LAGFTENDIEKLQDYVKFFSEKNYKLISQDNHSMLFSNEFIQFIIVKEHFGESNIFIKFLNENRTFGIGWISFIMYKNGQYEIEYKGNGIYYLLDFIKANFDKIIDINFCIKCMQEVEDFVKNELARKSSHS